MVDALEYKNKYAFMNLHQINKEINKITNKIEMLDRKVDRIREEIVILDKEKEMLNIMRELVMHKNMKNTVDELFDDDEGGESDE